MAAWRRAADGSIRASTFIREGAGTIPRQYVAAVVVLALAAVAAVLFLRTDSPRQPAVDAGPTPSEVAPSATASGVPEPHATAVTYVGFGHVEPRGISPTADAQQSKLWFTDGSWWGALLDPDGLFRVHRLDWASQTWVPTATVLDERRGARLDVVSVGEQLYVVAADTGPAPDDHVRFARYSYRSGAGHYVLDPDFPIAVTESGVEDLTLARDTKGTLWIAYNVGGRLMVNWTIGSDHIWSEPSAIRLPDAGLIVEEAAMIAYDEGLALMWSSTAQDALYMSSRSDDQPTDRWNATEVVIQGSALVDDHLHLQSFADETGSRLFVVFKTSLDAVESPNPLDAQLLLLVRAPDGEWTTHLIARVIDRHTRPILLIDEQHRRLYAMATSPSFGGSIYYKSTPLNEIGFEPGLGTPLVSHPGHPNIRDATSTNDPVNAETGMVVLGYDTSTGRYVHGALSLGGRRPPREGDRAEPPEGTPGGVVVNDRFDHMRSDGEIGFGWTASGTGTFSAVDAGQAGHVVATTSGVGDWARACRSFPEAVAALTIRHDVSMSHFGEASYTIGSLPGATTPVTLRVTSDGLLSYTDGGVQLNTRVGLTPARWYSSVLVLDPASATYDWTVIDRDSGVLVLAISDAAWAPATRGVHRFCLRTPAGLPGAELRIDNLQVAG
jgi:hypothetical protein